MGEENARNDGAAHNLGPSNSKSLVCHDPSRFTTRPGEVPGTSTSHQPLAPSFWRARADFGARVLMRAWRPIIAMAALVALLAFGAIISSAQQTAVCSATPGPGERIECTQPDTSSDEIHLTPKGIDIDTTAEGAHGVSGHHEGTGRIFIDIETGLAEGGGLIRNDIDTTGVNTHGVYGRHVGSGNIDIGGQNLHITTTGLSAPGVLAYLGYRDSSIPPP